tara:strand:- start:1429 stop:1626 length:198 start_codon:yes stop_codon:yes gene_type:complete
MAKALKVQVLVFESVEEVEMVLNGLYRIKEADLVKYASTSSRKKLENLISEVSKINAIFEAQNNN